MARPARRSIHVVVGEARDELDMSQRQFGEALGASHRSAVRWDAGQATPAVHHLHTLARLLYPRNRALAAEVADLADGETLESLGLEPPPRPSAPPPPPAPPPPAPRPEDLVDIVVLTAVEMTGSPPATIRPLLHAVFKRGREVGLTMEAAEQALRPPATTGPGNNAPARPGRRKGTDKAPT
jgi:hypothetical protein